MSDLAHDAGGSQAAKTALRSRLITARRRPSPAARLAAETQLHNQTLLLVRREHPSTIAAYAPIGTEPGGSHLLPVLAAHSRVLLPVLLPDNDLDWAAYSGTLAASTPRHGPLKPPAPPPGAREVLRPRGLLEPPGPRLGVGAITTADLVLVPALAVDRRGMRLGKGGGSYDRALARLAALASPPPVVALLHDGELIDHVPAEPHDRPVDAVLTPDGLVTLNPAVEWTK